MEIEPKAKILLDADVIIHFIKGDLSGKLHEIFENKLYLIDIVFDEVFKSPSQRTIVERMISIRFIEEIKLDESGNDVKMEYYRLTGPRGGNLGKGESAVLSYCRFNNDVVASSNISDIKNYCEQHSITYLTTMDFLAEAFKNRLFSEHECDEFIQTVKRRGSKLVNGIDHIRNYRTR